MQCDECQELLVSQGAECPPKETGDSLEQHLSTCESCAQAKLELESARRALSGWEEPSPPEGLARRTIAALEQERAGSITWWERIRQFFERELHANVSPLGGTLAAALGVMLFVLLMNFEHGNTVAATSAASCQRRLNEVCQAIESYRSDHGKLPGDLGQLVPDYIQEIPNCPSAGFDTFSPSYRVDSEKGSFVVYCEGNYHKKDGLKPDHPRCEGEAAADQ